MYKTKRSYKISCYWSQKVFILKLESFELVTRVSFKSCVGAEILTCCKLVPRLVSDQSLGTFEPGYRMKCLNVLYLEDANFLFALLDNKWMIDSYRLQTWVVVFNLRFFASARLENMCTNPEVEANGVWKNGKIYIYFFSNLHRRKTHKTFILLSIFGISLISKEVF